MATQVTDSPTPSTATGWAGVHSRSDRLSASPENDTSEISTPDSGTSPELVATKVYSTVSPATTPSTGSAVFTSSMPGLLLHTWTVCSSVGSAPLTSIQAVLV